MPKPETLKLDTSMTQRLDFSTFADLVDHMSRRLADTMPDFEIRLKAEVAWEVLRLKRERGAILLGHNYMEPALFSICDVRGDSLELARAAAAADADPIVFCGVRFMAETAKILNPTRTVLLPAAKAGCSLASSITAEDVRALRAAYPGVPVVAYINTYADVKAEVDVCVTSGNAAKILRSLDAERVIFVPDEYLARNLARETGIEILVPSVAGPRQASGHPGRVALPVLSAGGMVGWPGKCEVHDQFTLGDIESARRQFPDVVVLAHPECPPEVAAAADFSGSTSAMIRTVKEGGAHRYLLLTECSMADNISSEMPAGAEMLRLCSVRCPHMGEITLENVRDTLLGTYGEAIEMPEDLRLRAKRSIDRMLELS
jgi:quinolinate synthase